jgi:hypothetical protein
MAKLVHLKKTANGESFTVTPHAFETVIKADKNWRKHYDHIGVIDEEEAAHKSESARYKPNNAGNIADQVVDKMMQKGEEIRKKVEAGAKEERTEDIFSKEKGKGEGNKSTQGGENANEDFTNLNNIENGQEKEKGEGGGLSENGNNTEAGTGKKSRRK